MPRSQKTSGFFSDDTPLVYHFNTMTKKYYNRLHEKLSDVDIDRYYFILALICKHQNITQQCLCKCLKIDKASMVRVIDYLSKHGYVTRQVNPADRREHIIIPTQKALHVLPEFEHAFRELNNECLKGFSKSDKILFYKMMERVVNHLSGTESDAIFLKINKSKIQ